MMFSSCGSPRSKRSPCLLIRSWTPPAAGCSRSAAAREVQDRDDNLSGAFREPSAACDKAEKGRLMWPQYHCRLRVFCRSAQKTRTVTNLRPHSEQGLNGRGFAVMLGDVVLGRDGGVLFIPPQLAEQVVQYSEITQRMAISNPPRLQCHSHRPFQR